MFIFIRSNTFVVALTAKLFIGLTICQTRANGTAPEQVRLLEIQQAEQENSSDAPQVALHVRGSSSTFLYFLPHVPLPHTHVVFIFVDG